MLRQRKTGSVQPVHIGICGCDRHVGVTHFTLALATYLTSRCGKKVAVVEKNETGAMDELQRAIPFSGITTREESFHFQGVTYYKSVKPEDMVLIYNQIYDYFLIDFGKWSPVNQSELLRCSRKILLGDLKPWNRECYQKFMLETEIIREKGSNWDYLAKFAHSEDLHRIKKEMSLSLEPIPFIENPFCLTKDLFGFLHQFIL